MSANDGPYVRSVGPLKEGFTMSASAESVESDEPSDTPTPVSGKGLTQSQTRNLARVLAGDFEDALRQIEREIMQWREDKLNELNAERTAAESRIVDLNNEGLALKHRLEIEVSAFVASVKERGYEPAKNGYGGNSGYGVTVPQSFVPIGWDLKVAEVKRHADNAMRNARSILDSRQTAAQRKILIASIDSATALALLTEVPSMADVMAEAFNRDTVAIEYGGLRDGLRG